MANKIIDPMEAINSSMDECSFEIIKKLGKIGVNKFSGSRTIEYGGTTYSIIMDVQIKRN